MTKKLTKTNMIYAFSKENEPVSSVDPGMTIEIETYDCFENQIQSIHTEVTGIDWDRINPATGPIYVNGALPGDVLKVTIDKLEIGSQGVLATGPDLGVLGHRFEKIEHKMIQIQDEKAIFNEKVKIPINPMIGVIGVAPAEGQISCGTPGAHGGNMDTKLITEGVTLYLPVFIEGALFALGDFHAAMGDGEVSATGIEVPGKATVTLDVLKTKSPLDYPVVANEEGIAMIATAETIDEAIQQSTETLINLLLPHTDLTLSELTMLMSASGDTQVSQVVNPLKTARFFIPHYILNAYKINLFE